MKITILAALNASALLLAVAVPAIGADGLTVGQCIEVYNGLSVLNHYDDPVTGKPRQYKLGGSARLTIALDLSVLKSVVDSTDKARTGLIEEIMVGKPIVPNSPEFVKLNNEYQKVLSASCPVTPGHLDIKDMKIGDRDGDNAIPPDVIAAIVPILDR